MENIGVKTRKTTSSFSLIYGIWEEAPDIWSDNSKENYKGKNSNCGVETDWKPKSSYPGQHLGTLAVSNAPCKGKSFKIHLIKMENPLRYVKLLPLQGDRFAFMITQGAALG